MECDQIHLPTLKERKKLLGFLDEPGTPCPLSFHRKGRPSEDPFPLRGSNTPCLDTAKKFSTLPRKPKKPKMADKPPIAPKPRNAPVPRPRKKGPPPLRPVPYHKHKEHKEYEVLTFKSNHPINKSTEKPPPPQPLEKPPRRYSAKGEPSEDFYKPKSKEQNPIQYTVPSVPGRQLNDSDQGSMFVSRPRLNTPIVPTVPPQHVLSNGATQDEIDTSSVDPARFPQAIADKNADEVVNGVNDGPLYREPYDHVQIEREEIEAYAIVSPTRKAALPEPRPRLVTPLSPPPVSPKPTSTLKDQSTSISPTSTSGSEVPLESYDHVPNIEDEEVDGYSIVPPILKRTSMERMRRSKSPSPSPHLSSAPPFPPQPAGPTEYSVTVHSTSPGLPLSPSPTPRSNRSVDVMNSDEYSLLDRPDHGKSSPQVPSPSISGVYSPLEVEAPVVPLAGNPTQEAGYSHLETSAPNDGEYEVVTPEPLRKFKIGQEDLFSIQPNQHPKAKARKASQKIKDGSVQLQSARDRSDLISYNSSDKILPDSPLSPKESASRPLPLPRPRRPPTSPETTSEDVWSREPVATIAHVTSERSTDAHGFSRTVTGVPDQLLEQAGYETLNTFSPEPDTYIDSSFDDDDDDDDSEVVEVVRTVLSPKVELDIDHIIRIRSALDNADGNTVQGTSDLREKKRYENQVIVDVVAQENQSKSESSQLEYGDALSSPDMFTVPQHAVPGPLGYCAIEVLPSIEPPPDMFTVPQHAVPGPLGYCAIEVLSSIEPPPDSDAVGARVVKGDMVEVHHLSYPNAEGYCDLGVSGTSPTNGDSDSNSPRVDVRGYCDIDVGIAPALWSVSGDQSEGTEQGVRTDAQESNDVNDESFAHTYDVIQMTTKRTISEPPKTKPKPKKDTDRSPRNSSHTVCESEGDGKRSSSKKMPLDVPGKVPKKGLNPPRRRAPPPPTVARSSDDSLVGSPKKDLPDKVITGGIATLPRGQSLTTSSKATKVFPSSPKRAFSSDSQYSKQPVKLLSVKKLAENDTSALSPPASPKADFPSPGTKKKSTNFLNKLRMSNNNAESSPSGPPNLVKKRWRKKSLREKGHHESPGQGQQMLATDKTKSLPATGRIVQKPLVLPSLDPLEDESGIYSTIAVANKKPPLPPAASLAHPPKNTETKQPMVDNRGYEVIESKRRSFRKKKAKKAPPLRKTNSDEHLYDVARPPVIPPPVQRQQQDHDGIEGRGAQVGPVLQPPLPHGHPIARPLFPDMLPEGMDITGLYAVVTSKKGPSIDTENSTQGASEEGQQVTMKSLENGESTLKEDSAVGGSGENKKDPSPGDSPSKSSLLEREGIVITSLDEKFGEGKSLIEETFISSADIEHTVSGGQVYAVVQSRPKSKKKKSNVNESLMTSESASLPDVQASDGDPAKLHPPDVPIKPPRSGKGPPPKPTPFRIDDKTRVSSEFPKAQNIDDLSQPPNKLPPAPPSPENDLQDTVLSIEKTQSLNLGSGPPSFPPPPPPKSSTPEPGGEKENDPAYEIISVTSKRTKPRKVLLLDRPTAPSPPKDEQLKEGAYAIVSDVLKTKTESLSSQEMVLLDDAIKPDVLLQKRPPHLYSTVEEAQDEESPEGVVAVPMVSHGYATVAIKNRTPNKPPNKKRLPQLKPRTKPPPAPPMKLTAVASPSGTLSPGHQQVARVSSAPLEHLMSPLDSATGSLIHSDKRTHSVDSTGRVEYAEPKFLFSQKLCQSLIAVGDSPDPIPSPCPSTNTLASIDDDSDADIMYSTEWDSSTDEEDEGETVPRSKTYYIAREVLTTERTFVKGLTLLDKDFRQAVRSANNAHEKTVLSEESLKLILGNVSSLLNLNSGMLQELEERMSKWDEDPRIGDIVLIRAPYLKLYTEYISKFDKALKTLDECTKRNPLFAEMLHEFEAQPKCASLPLAGYMLDIVQRITRYKMLFTDYVKHLPEDSADRLPSEKALEIVSSVATHVNETIRQMDNFRKVVEVRKKLIGDAGDTLITPYRKLLKEGELLKFARKERQPRMFFLFNDILIYASFIPPGNNTYKVIKRIPLEGMQVEPLDDPEMRYGFQIVSTCKSFRLEASNREEKQQWLAAFETAIKEQTERMKNRERARRNLADQASNDDTDSVPLGHLAPPWLPDSAVSMCQLCSVSFTVTRRRHHCRACGMIFCGDCSSYYVTLKYMNNKTDRVCQSCYGKINIAGSDDNYEKSPQKRPSRLSRSHKFVNMPSVLREVKARDQSAQISGYLQAHTSKSKRWKKRWFVIYNLVLYEFERHEDVTAKRSITLPSYQVISPVPRHDDPLVFVLKHAGTGKEYFKVENAEQLERWIDVLQKAVCGEVDEDIEATAIPNTVSPETSLSPQSLDSPDTSSPQ